MTEQIRRAGDGEELLPEHYIEASQSLVEQPLRVLKYDSMFAVMNAYGDVDSGAGPQGLYYNDTRFLSFYALRFETQRPLLLSSILLDNNAALSVDLTNPDIRESEGVIQLARDTILINRIKFLYASTWYERISLRSFSSVERAFGVELLFDADFRDLFEVRGTRRDKHGTRIVDTIGDDSVVFRYSGLDGLARTTTLRFSPAPKFRNPRLVRWPVVLSPKGHAEILITVACGFDPPVLREPTKFVPAYRAVRRVLRERSHRTAQVTSANEIFNTVLKRSKFDLGMLQSQTEHGLYPAAGVPWYSTIFGRDGIVTALFCLWWDPTIAKGVLEVLAATQAKTIDPVSDAQPGKILHESRAGEMARLGEVPFRLYYGSVDATPLFVLLAGKYLERTGDLGTIKKIWPAIQLALKWIDEFGDRDGDGFVEYFRASANGLVNQGWKDSHDSIFHVDGTLATGPIALCEVQAYVYGAKLAGATLAHALDLPGEADRLARAADGLRTKFLDAFWLDDLGVYALALDGEKRPCRVISSNAGHALLTGIATQEHAARMSRTLLEPSMFSSWGVRTIATTESRYNPMSYHNGSIWPHDNALIAMGLSRYGYKKQAGDIFEGIYLAATYQDQLRLPELFCGLARKAQRGPTSYPVACSPQAWAAAAPFAFLSASLGLEMKHAENCVHLSNPYLPDFLTEVSIRALQLGEARLDLKFTRYGPDVTVNVSRNAGDARVILEK